VRPSRSSRIQLTELEKVALSTRLSARLLAWWPDNQRRYPWRETPDPYRILLAELMLHRTRADQVLPVYREFLKRFPTARSIRSDSADEVLRILRPLGLQWRSRLVVGLFAEVNSTFGGRVPTSATALRQLPGVSDYISNAVTCFATGEPTLMLDTNIVRVLGRVGGDPTSDSSRRSPRFRELLRSLLPRASAPQFYFSILDLAAQVCRPRNPRCDICPIAGSCAYGRDWRLGIQSRPLRAVNATVIRTRGRRVPIQRPATSRLPSLRVLRTRRHPGRRLVRTNYRRPGFWAIPRG
jgi:A/G-specific adenine glycosylase